MLDHVYLPVLEFDKEENIDISILVANHLVAVGKSLRNRLLLLVANLIEVDLVISYIKRLCQLSLGFIDHKQLRLVYDLRLLHCLLSLRVRDELGSQNEEVNADSISGREVDSRCVYHSELENLSHNIDIIELIVLEGGLFYLLKVIVLVQFNSVRFPYHNEILVSNQSNEVVNHVNFLHTADCLSHF